MYNIRAANIKDAIKILEIRNQEEVRQFSLHNKSIISYKEHKDWFSKKLKNKEDLFFIIEDKDSLLGFCRLDLAKKHEYYISIAIDSQNKSKGLGSLLMKYSISILSPGDIIYAQIEQKNIISQKFFKKHGFIENKKGVYKFRVLDD